MNTLIGVGVLVLIIIIASGIQVHLENKKADR